MKRTLAYRIYISATIALGIAAATLTMQAKAGTVGFMPNKAGGRIQLTDITSERCKELTAKTQRHWQYAVSTSPEGGAIRGCWTLVKDDGQVEIAWGSDGGYKTSLFDLEDFTRTEYNQRTYDSVTGRARVRSDL